MLIFLSRVVVYWYIGHRQTDRQKDAFKHSFQKKHSNKKKHTHIQNRLPSLPKSRVGGGGGGGRKHIAGYRITHTPGKIPPPHIIQYQEEEKKPPLT